MKHVIKWPERLIFNVKKLNMMFPSNSGTFFAFLPEHKIFLKITLKQDYSSKNTTFN